MTTRVSSWDFGGAAAATEAARRSSPDVDMLAQHSGTMPPNATARRLSPSLILNYASTQASLRNLVGHPQMETSACTLRTAHVVANDAVSVLEGVTQCMFQRSSRFQGADLTQAHKGVLLDRCVTKGFAVSADTILYDSLTGLNSLLL